MTWENEMILCSQKQWSSKLNKNKYCQDCIVKEECQTLLTERQEYAQENHIKTRIRKSLQES